MLVKTKPAPKEMKLFDGGGLFLLIPAFKLDNNGKPLPTSKLWRFKYRFAGKEKFLSFGSYPTLSLADARQRRKETKKLLANGFDPSELKKSQKAAIIFLPNQFSEYFLSLQMESLEVWTEASRITHEPT